MPEPHSHADDHEHFSTPLFVATVVGTLAVLFTALWYFFPHIWASQFQASWWKWLVTIAVTSACTCYFEFFFHRYLLHTPAIPLLRRLYKQHTLHHALTRIARRKGRDGRDVLYVENKFPIVEPEQGEASFFPWYSLGVFALVLSPILVGLHFLAPSFPWFVGGLLALTNSLILYEVLHAINHWAFEKWEPLIHHPRWAGFWRPVYGFHLRHHAVIDCNESISGFFGLPLADWTFRTCVIPKTIFSDGEEAHPEHFVSPRPVALIRFLDRLAARSIQKRRAPSPRVDELGERRAHRKPRPPATRLPR